MFKGRRVVGCIATFPGGKQKTRGKPLEKLGEIHINLEGKKNSQETAICHSPLCDPWYDLGVSQKTFLAKKTPKFCVFVPKHTANPTHPP